MVRKQAIKRLIWQFLLIVISSLIFKTIWAAVIVLYFVRTLFFAGRVASEPTPFKEKEEYVSVKSAIITDSVMALVMIGLPLIPSIILVNVFPDYRWVSSVVSIVVLLHLIVKPIFYDLIRAFTNNEHHIDVTKKVVNTATIVIIIGVAVQLALNIWFPQLFMIEYDHKALWNEYVTEHNLDEEFRSYIGDEEPTYINGSQNTESIIGNTFEIGTKNGLIQQATFSVVFALDEEKKEWYVSEYNYREENTYELPQDTTWTGSNGGNSYTVTLAKGFLYDTTGHITIKGSSGEVLLDSDIVCKKVSDKENKYFFTTEVDLGWWNYDLSMLYSEEDGSFTFYNCYEGTIYLQN